MTTNTPAERINAAAMVKSVLVSGHHDIAALKPFAPIILSALALAAKEAEETKPWTPRLDFEGKSSPIAVDPLFPASPPPKPDAGDRETAERIAAWICHPPEGKSDG